MAKVSHIVSGFTHWYSTHEPTPHSTAANVSVCQSDSSPLAVARHAVRRILASMLFSTRQLNTAAAPATSQMPKDAIAIAARSAGVGTPGTASTMPMSAQKTMSCTTRGFVSA